LLHCDHIVPVAEGGGNEETNLITSCVDCNLGKSDVPLSVVPKSLADKAIEIEEREAQIAGYREIMQARIDRVEADAWRVVRALMPWKKDEIRKDWFISIKMFLGKLDLFEVLDAAEIAGAAKGRHADSTLFKYFCGVCWRKIKDEQNG
jgi:hypothetical protein